MLKKRIVGTITVKNGRAVQSMGYHCHLPLGRAEIIAENLDRWGVDEIIIQCVDRSNTNLGPDFVLLEKIAAIGLGTPIIYSGGIRNVEDAVRVIQSGADRIAVDALLRDDPSAVSELATRLGSQAIIAAMPVAMEQGQLQWLDYRRRCQTELSDQVLSLLKNKDISEVLLIDWKNEGKQSAFDLELIRAFPLPDMPLIVFGGLSDAPTLHRALSCAAVSAAAVGNFLNYREHAIQTFKEQLVGIPLRQPEYCTLGI